MDVFLRASLTCILSWARGEFTLCFLNILYWKLCKFNITLQNNGTTTGIPELIYHCAHNCPIKVLFHCRQTLFKNTIHNGIIINRKIKTNICHLLPYIFWPCTLKKQLFYGFIFITIMSPFYEAAPFNYSSYSQSPNGD